MIDYENERNPLLFRTPHQKPGTITLWVERRATSHRGTWIGTRSELTEGGSEHLLYAVWIATIEDELRRKGRTKHGKEKRDHR